MLYSFTDTAPCYEGGNLQREMTSAMDSSTQLIMGVLFGSVGFGFLTYSWRQKAVVPLLVGVAISVIPYLIPNVWVLVAVGIVLLGVSYFIRI